LVPWTRRRCDLSQQRYIIDIASFFKWSEFSNNSKDYVV